MAKRGNIFRRLPRPNVQKSNFDLSFDHRTTFDMGRLIPILCEETLPGDSWTLQCEPFIRAAALLAPVMSRIDVRVDYFHVSNRIMWPSWERFYKAELVNKAPYLTVNASAPNQIRPGMLGDYMGLPAFENDMSNFSQMEVSAFPFAAYNFIWNEFYRHQHLQNEKPYILDSDNNDDFFQGVPLGLPYFRNWTHDYFTTANPFPAAGAGSMNIPVSHAQAVTPVRRVSDDTELPEDNLRTGPNSNLRTTTVNTQVYTDPTHEGTIEDLRRAIQVQSWVEKLLRGGTRMREMLYSFFGVDNMDARMQIPEYIGSHSNSLKISEVLSTADTVDNLGPDTGSPVGQLSGHGVSAGNSKKMKFFARENGWIIGLLSVQPKPSYMNQGLHKKFSRSDIYDFYFPQFAHFGEQAIKNKEIFVDATEADQEDTFGYIPRFSEYKFKNNRVSGEFSSNLDFWTFARKFDGLPTLDAEFLEADVTVNPFAIQDGSHNLRAMVYHNNKCVRPMPRFSTPKTGG